MKILKEFYDKYSLKKKQNSINLQENYRVFREQNADELTFPWEFSYKKLSKKSLNRVPARDLVNPFNIGHFAFNPLLKIENFIDFQK